MPTHEKGHVAKLARGSTEQSPLTLARNYLGRQLAPIPVPHKQKGPIITGWQNLLVTTESAPQYFNGGKQNVGILLGAPSGDLTDADLDDPVAIELAPHFLPPTGSRFGRKSKRSSHWEYYAPGAVTTPFKTKDDGSIVELRSTGAQTIFPGSTHESGERVEWEEDGQPAVVDAAELTQAVRKLAAATLIVLHYPVVGTRHDLTLALSGMLLGAGWTDENTEHFVEVISKAAGANKIGTKLKTIADTRQKLDAGEPIKGLTDFKALISEPVGKTVADWLEIRPPRSATAATSSLPDPADHPEHPVPDPGMFYGMVREFVEIVEPHTEADKVALAGQFLVAAGNAIGSNPRTMVEATPHPARLFLAAVGATGRGRKGTSLDRVLGPVRGADTDWAENCQAEGLSSGEGLIWAVRDPIVKPGRRGSVDDVLVDEGVSDKRLLIVESEFASPLRAMKREGSTLSAIIRKAWDNGDLRSLTKNSPAKATGAHISLIVHITADELRSETTTTDVANGFLNRFLLICTRRSKLLPDGGNPYPDGLDTIRQRLAAIIRDRRDLGTLDMQRDDAARDLWHDVYPRLSEGRAGLLGAVTSRAEAQVTRLALLYALLDAAEEIRRPHLEAALAFWKYCADSAAFIFGTSLGKPDAERVAKALGEKSEGMTRTEIHGLFGNNDTKRVAEALTVLVQNGQARCEKVATGGRPVERWFLSSLVP